MEINSLSALVLRLIVSRDSLVLPGEGTFVATLFPASFSDKGYTINPPYRELSFVPDPNVSDEVLYRAWAEQNSIDEQEAKTEVDKCLQAIADDLRRERVVKFDGLGKLRMTAEGEVFFVTDPEAQIYPEAFGLEPVYLKNRDLQKGREVKPASAEESIEEEVNPIIELASVEKPASTVLQAESNGPAPVETPAEPAEKPVEESSDHAEEEGGGKSWIAVVVLVVIIVILLAVIALRLLGTYAPDFIDRLLYSPDEFKQLHSSLGGVKFLL